MKGEKDVKLKTSGIDEQTLLEKVGKRFKVAQNCCPYKQTLKHAQVCLNV